MTVDLKTSAIGTEAGYSETGTLTFSDANTFSGSSTYSYDVPATDPNAGGGQCTQSGLVGGSPPAPAPIAPWCPCIQTGGACTQNDHCCSGTCYEQSCIS